MTTQILNISTDEYLSDPCAVPSLSYSVAKILLEKSPLHVRIVVNRQPIHIGYFRDPIEGAKAYDEAALKYFGEFAVTNESLGLLK